MGSYSVLEIASVAAARIGQAIPTTVVGTTDLSTSWSAALVSMASFITTEWDWPELLNITTFTADAAESQADWATLTGGTGFERLVPDTLLNVTQLRKCIGPLTPPEWSQIRALGGTPGIDYFRLEGASFKIFPYPNGTDEYSFQWISKYHWLDGATPETLFSSDNSVWRLDDMLAIAGTAFFWKMARGMDFGAEEVMLRSRAKTVMGRSKMAGTINVADCHTKTGPGIYFPVLVS